MARNTGRRRRFLSEEARAAGNGTRAEVSLPPGDTPRYGAGANIENHPQVTDLVPRRYRIVTLVLLVSISASCVAELSVRSAEQWSEMASVVSASEIKTALSDRLLSWVSAAFMLLVAAYARLIYSLRRHRVDDYRGRYRIWKTASWAAVGLSLVAVLNTHGLAGRLVGHWTGWSLLPNNAGAWLAPAALLGGWLLVKLTKDVAECRAAMASYLLAIACFGLGSANSLGWSPSWLAGSPDMLARTLPAIGYSLLLTGSMLYARYVVLDVQGLIEHTETSAPANDAATLSVHDGEADQPSDEQSPVAAKLSADSGEWIDGSEPEDRRLSKAERKRLRKQKNRKRAA